ncbi:MAG: hypothetical protein ACLR2E_24600 [Lachnospiraceae bacterium]
MCRGGRDQGIGSTFIRELLHKLNPEFWILEVEDIASAANEEEQEIRTRRMDFIIRTVSKIRRCTPVSTV